MSDKMLYKIIESFSPAGGDTWIKYCAWRGLRFDRFESIDQLLRPDIFDKPEAEDWDYIVNEDYMLSYYTDRDYAIKKHSMRNRGNLVGVKFANHNEADKGFLGYDLIDGFHSISLLTNWGGNNLNIVDRLISPNALVIEHEQIISIQNFLHEKYGNDPHVENCQVVSIYNPFLA